MEHHSEQSQQMGSGAQQSGSPWRRWLWLGGCVAPLGAAVAVLAFNVPVNAVLLVGLLALCPLAHLFLMRGGEHKH